VTRSTDCAGARTRRWTLRQKRSANRIIHRHNEKVLASKPLAADYLNAGHVAWRTGKIEKAAELYSKAALEYGGQEIFREMFGKDKETLVRQGISEKDIPLMMDLV
jgi:hypothetical protein